MDIGSRVKEVLAGKVAESGEDKGQLWIRVRAEDIVEVLSLLRDDAGLRFDFIVDLCGVDNFPGKERFEVVYHILSSSNNCRLRIKISVPEDTMTVPSVIAVWKAADWLEREAYDMFGIKFEGHPDLRRILMHEDYPDFPLRKEFPLKGWREKVD